MDILVDTREHKSEWERIELQFINLGVKYKRSKLPFGDYMSLDNARHVVDRKKDLQELVGNIVHQHDRFIRELTGAQEMGIKITILCEHGGNIKSLQDVPKWYNPRLRTSPMATTGLQLYKALCTISKRYNVDIQFCDKRHTGRRIVEILGDGQNSVDG